MKTKKVIKNLLLTVVALVAAVAIVGLGFWLIDGRSPQAYIVSHALTRSTMETYEQQKGDKTDKSHVEIPDGIQFPREVTQYKVGGMQVFECPAEDEGNPVVFYIHGGAYYLNFSTRHWNAMAEWAKTTGCGIVTPNYPLLYRYTVKDAFPLLMQLYRQLQQRFSARRIILMGDSAGGGFSLALVQEMAKTDSVALPSSLILISPWVDITGGDDSLQEYDTFLNAEVLRHVGADWAGELDVRNPMVSPLYGDMQSLPPTDLYTGTWEVFYTDIIKTYEKMKAAGVSVNLHVKERMGHVYPLWPCPEGAAARKEIAAIINGRKM